MRVEQLQWTDIGKLQLITDNGLGERADLVLVFGARTILAQENRFFEIRSRYPNAQIVLSSTSGEIMDDLVFDESLSITAIDFEKTELKAISIDVNNVNESFDSGVKLAEMLNAENLCHVFVLSDGLNVNGSEIVKGINSVLPDSVSCTGGLAGDAASFNSTLVGLNTAPKEKSIVAIGFYGENLQVGFGSVGGWDNFGAERLVTRSKGNVLYELDGQSALELYKMYLGEKAAELPGSALLFPLGMKFGDDFETIVRTVLAVDDANGSMTFAGDIPEGCYVRLMKANFDKLIDGARLAAEHSLADTSSENRLAVLISCVGRKLILGQRVDEEVEVVKRVMGDHTVITGFYSYGEISPVDDSRKCELHNQTMTITTFSEV